MSILSSAAVAMRQGVNGATATGVTNSAKLLQAGANTIFEIIATNPDATYTNLAWFNVYDAATAGAVTVGSTTIVAQFEVPGNSTVVYIPSTALAITNGVVVSATTTASGSSAPTTALLGGYVEL